MYSILFRLSVIMLFVQFLLRLRLRLIGFQWNPSTLSKVQWVGLCFFVFGSTFFWEGWQSIFHTILPEIQAKPLRVTAKVFSPSHGKDMSSGGQWTYSNYPATLPDCRGDARRDELRKINPSHPDNPNINTRITKLWRTVKILTNPQNS